MPPVRNAFGIDIENRLLPGTERPLSIDAFNTAVPQILRDIADLDSDGDGFDNQMEIEDGTSPGDAGEFPMNSGCSGEHSNPMFDVCGYDPAYVYKRISLDVCGYSPTFQEMEALRSLFPDAQDEAIQNRLTDCFQTSFWRGRDGVIWRLAHPKVRPIAAIKSGQNAGPVPLGDYDDDYALFVYTQTGDRDARLVLTADFYVTLDDQTGEFSITRNALDQSTQQDRRAGMLTTRYFFVVNTMFTAVPRTTAAQAYRSYLGLDIAKSEGLIAPIGRELIDYDDKGITAPECAVCHTTLDPLTYPFSRYHGISGLGSGRYDAGRMDAFNPAIEGAQVRDVPEAGFLFGEPVANLNEWAQLAANSDAFAQATVKSYWVHLVGRPPLSVESAEYEALWRDFGPVHEFQVEKMIRALVKTEAYGVP